MIHGEQRGPVHRNLSHDHPPDLPIEAVHVLVCVYKNGGEGIYGQMIGNVMTNFVTESEARKILLNDILDEQGTFEVAPRLGVKLEWRTYIHF